MSSNRLILYYLVVVAISLLNVQLSASQVIGNCSATEFSIPITTSNWRMIFIFNCRPMTPFNPSFPEYYLTQATKYNEIDLSPNFFTQLPLSSLCQFKYTTSLDMSHNYIGSLRNAFVDLGCLNMLSHIDFSYNLISTPLLASDFDDAFASQIGSINLTGNLIPAIESRAFLRLDGSSRFPELTYLGLAHNRIRDFDLLWPLTLPSPILNIDLKINPITRLVNQFGYGYSNEVFRYNMTGFRHVDITTNSLQYLDDSNMLQYGLLNEYDMRDFLMKISNYDFRQSNLVRTFICYCPSYGLNTVRWYKQVSNQLDTSLPIFQLFCKEFPNLVYVFNFPCNDSKTVTSKTTSTTTTTTTTTTTLSEEISQSQSFLFGSDKKQLLKESIRDNSVITGDSQSTTNNNLYYLLFLLLIPVVLLIVLMFICCCGRCCQVHSSFLVCPCMRPNDRSLFSGKTYDVALCFNRFDETWVDEELVSEIVRHDPRYRIQKLALSGRPSAEKIGRDSERILRSAKRVVLVFTQDFVEDDFKNRSFLALLKDLAQTDPNCVMIAVNKSLDTNVFHYCVDYLDSPTRDSRSFEKSGYYEKMSLSSRLAANVKYHCGLRDVEKLDFSSGHFNKNFLYILPILDSDSVNTKPKKKKGSLDYPGVYKDPRKLRHIVIPIPEFMKTKLGGFSASRLKSNKTHTTTTNNDDNDESDYYNSKNHQRRQRASSNSTRSTNTTAYAASYQQQDTGSRDFFTTMPPHSNRAAANSNNYNDSNSEMISKAATNAYLHRHTALFASSGQKTREPPLAVIKTSASSYQEVETNLNIRQHQQRRCETPDILALFAPRPDQVIELSGSRTSSSSVCQTAIASSNNSSNKRRSSSSRPISREGNNSQQQQPQPQQRSSSSSRKVILQGTSNSAYDNEVDA